MFITDRIVQPAVFFLIKESISKGWAALEYDSTPEKYEKWEKMKRSVKTAQQSSKEIADMMKYLNNDFD